jgi:hypothetical protein
MCPFCVASLGLVVAGIVSTGGLATLAVKVSAKRDRSIEDKPNSGEGSKDNGNEQNCESESSHT